MSGPLNLGHLKFAASIADCFCDDHDNKGVEPLLVQALHMLSRHWAAIRDLHAPISKPQMPIRKSKNVSSQKNQETDAI
jgi:hypothetical protein